MISLLNSLSARRYCRFIAQLSAKLNIKFSRTQDLIAKLGRNSRVSFNSSKTRRTCRHWKSRVSHFKMLFNIDYARKSKIGKSEKLEMINKELPSLFNNLPLPFQCEVLFEVGQLSVFKPFEAPENSVNSVTKMNLYEVGNVITKSEKTLIEDISIVSVADRCVKVLAGKKYRTTDVVLSVALGNHQVRKWEQSFRVNMQWIMGRFAERNGIKLDGLHNLTSKHNLPYSAYFTHLLNSSLVGDRLELTFHMHLRKANTKALEARFVLAALDAVDRNTLLKIFQVHDIKYWAVDHFIGTGIGPEHSYNLKMLFPSYLRRFFNTSLQRHEKCLILHLVTQYSNSSNEKVTSFLKRKRIEVKFPCSIMNGVMSVVLSPKRNRENQAVVRKTEPSVGNTTPRTLELHPFWNVGRTSETIPVTNSVSRLKKTYVHYRKATMVEIVMFVLLGSLSVVLVIFFVTCVLFIVRKRRLRKHMDSMSQLQQQQQRLQMEAPPQSIEESAKNATEPVLDHNNGNIIISSFTQVQMERVDLSSPRGGNSLHDNQGNCRRVVNITLEPLRFSTDDEESRCDDEDSSRFSPTSKHFDPSSFYRGGKRLVPAVRYSKSLARKRAESEGERTVLEKVPEAPERGSKEHFGDEACGMQFSGSLECHEEEDTAAHSHPQGYECKLLPKMCPVLDDKLRSVEQSDLSANRTLDSSQEVVDEKAPTSVSDRTKRKRTKKSSSSRGEKRTFKTFKGYKHERRHKTQATASRNGDTNSHHNDGVCRTDMRYGITDCVQDDVTNLQIDAEDYRPPEKSSTIELNDRMDNENAIKKIDFRISI